MAKFDLLNYEDGSIFIVKDGTKYVKINGVAYNVTRGGMNEFDFIYINRDGTVSKFPSGAKNVVKVYQMTSAPAANRLSEGLKWASGLGSKYKANLVYDAAPATPAGYATMPSFVFCCDVVFTNPAPKSPIDKAIASARPIR